MKKMIWNSRHAPKLPVAMRLSCFFLVLSLLPLGAQTSMDDAAKVNPPATPAPDVIAAHENESTSAISTNYMLPTPPVFHASLESFAVSPGTIREGIAYHELAKTIATLSYPAAGQLSYAVVSSDPRKLACTPIIFNKGDQQAVGGLVVKWDNIERDCQVSLKIYDPDHPDIILHARLYLRKTMTEAKETEAENAENPDDQK